MPFVKVMINSVWGTKRREPVLTNQIRQKVIDHIKENAVQKEIHIDRLYGHIDHLPCLFELNPGMSVSKALQLIKGESAYWINKQEILKSKFEWADEYFAVPVSESMLDTVRAYIDNQEEHHKKITFAEEYKNLLNKYNFGDH